MEKIILSEEEMNRANSINGRYYTIITRPADSGKFRISAVWVKDGQLIADWATKTVNYMYEVNSTIISLSSEIFNKKDSLKFAKQNFGNFNRNYNKFYKKNKDK